MIIIQIRSRNQTVIICWIARGRVQTSRKVPAAYILRYPSDHVIYGIMQNCIRLDTSSYTATNELYNKTALTARIPRRSIAKFLQTHVHTYIRTYGTARYYIPVRGIINVIHTRYVCISHDRCWQAGTTNARNVHRRKMVNGKRERERERCDSEYHATR